MWSSSSAVREVPVGFRHVCQRMLAEPVCMGGEESGGFGYGGHLPERDGILTALLTLEMIAAADRPLSALVDDLRARYAGKRPVRVFVQLSTRPLYTVSDRQLIGRVLDVCGATNVFGTHGGLTPVVGPEAVVAARPELILSTGGESADDPFAAWRRFPDLPAVADVTVSSAPAPSRSGAVAPSTKGWTRAAAAPS